MKKNDFVIDINPEEWKTYTFKQKMAYFKKLLADNKGSITDSFQKNLEDLLDSIRNATNEDSLARRYADLGTFGIKATKFITDVSKRFTREKIVVTSQYDYILKYLVGCKRDDLYVDEIVVNSEILRLFCENIEKIAESGVFKLDKLEYGKADKPSDVVVSYVVTYGENEFELNNFKFFIRCEYHKSNDNALKNTISVPTGSLTTAFSMAPIDEIDAEFTDYEDVSRLILRVALENYVKNIDVKNNFIKLEPYGDMRTIKRQVVPFNIHNFDMETMVKEMKTCLKKKRHRGYMFIGDPGTGKTVSIQKFLDQFTDIPVFWVDSSTLQSVSSIRDIFKNLHYFPKSICIFDDIDAVDLSYKSAQTTAFIECMDNKDDAYSYGGITIMTVNEPNRVHSSIKTRSGRIDQILYIHNPNSKEQIFDIITQRYVNAQLDMPEEFTLEDENFVRGIEKCIQFNFTHAHIAGIIDDIILFCDEAEDETLIEMFNKMVDTKVDSLKNANLKTKDGYLDTSEKFPLKPLGHI